MSAIFATIVEELRRQQREGVERVFIGDGTLDQLIASGNDHAQDAHHASGSTTNEAAGAVGADLRSLIDTPASPPKPSGSLAHRDASPPKVFDAPPEIILPEGDAPSQLAYVRDRVLACPTCNAQLNPHGKVVFGAGNPTADIFFCGEAPGADEEREGTPFVGKAGQLLDKVISAMGLARDQVYITNILNWRPRHDKPYGNRPPTSEEMRFCLPYLKAQISVVQPKVIVALGNTAVSGLLGPDPGRKMGKIRGTWQAFEDIPMMITFHPSYLLRNGTLKTKRMVWEDMLQVMEKCGLPITTRQRNFFLPKS